MAIFRILRKCGENLSYLEIDSCRSDEVLENLTECTNLKSIFYIFLMYT